MNDNFPPPPYTARHFDRQASELRAPAYRRAHMRRFHPYPRYSPPLVVVVLLPRQDSELIPSVAAAAMVREDETREKKFEGGRSWKWVPIVLIVFAVLSHILERANLL
ncbi:uncharacterized protein BT62DRAFT_924979 [Guyanagaster necrorhizus]|uniref:Uncharacterized protein n=1 Tax=Guyanagaster necrorhizus TaxID=856835 RepID=A0A9P7W5B8_9AGAR|nr:uncharacterized protein BT62DRAFT_924979 [Guyanagaster necrorhizus MCA 3950]KAG7452423.1 hypothetical protein BT62DRAFT_924979 [Guyanagaster necrorhizus MCA 3950]